MTTPSDRRRKDEFDAYPRSETWESVLAKRTRGTFDDHQLERDEYDARQYNAAVDDLEQDPSVTNLLSWVYNHLDVLHSVAECESREDDVTPLLMEKIKEELGVVEEP